MKIFMIMLLTSTCFLKVKGDFQSLDEVKNNCNETKMSKNSNLAFYGWPLLIECRTLVRDEFKDEDYSTPITCQIWAPNGTSIFNVSNDLLNFLFGGAGRLDIQEVRGNSTNFTISANLDNGDCVYQAFDVNLTNPETCEEYERNNMRGPADSANSAIGSKQYLMCDVPFGVYPKLPLNSLNFTYEWKRSCSESIISTNEVLKLNDLKAEDGGEYICSVNFNKMQRTLRSFYLCLRKLPSGIIFIVNCDNAKTLRKQIGETATFSCRVTFPNGKPNHRELFVHWMMEKNNDNTNLNRCVTDVSHTADPRKFCIIDFGPRCIISDDLSVPFNLTIRNISDSDYGNYTIVARSVDKYFVNTTLTLKRNEIPALLSAAEITGICIAILFIFIFISLLVFYNFIYVKVYYKRWFANFVPNDKKYGVFLAYHFSQEIDRFAKTTVQESIQKICQLLEKMGYLVYDEKRQFNASGRADNIHASMEDCHRILILLSAEFIKDDWSLFALQEGFNEMVSSGTKLVFILLPGMKEYLKQNAQGDEGVYQVIQRALKVNYVIQMPEQKRFASKRFSFQLENALPKLEKVGLEPLKSTSRKNSLLVHCNNEEL